MTGCSPLPLPRLVRSLVIASSLAIAVRPAFACSSVQLSAADGSSVVARTMDFAYDLDDRVILYPRGMQVRSQGPDGAPGLAFTTKYAAFGLFPLGVKIAAADAMNEKGLTLALQWLQASEFPTTVPPGRADRALGVEDAIRWLLGQFASVDEVKAGLPDVSIWAAPIPQMGNALPALHFILFDASGKGLVLEFLNGKLAIRDNPVGVATNDPPFDWQLTNLQNFVALSPVNAPARRFGDLPIPAHASGSGATGIPGGFLPSSRFVRLVAGRSFSPAPADAASALAAVSHVIATAVVPKGFDRIDASAGAPTDFTLYTTLRDQKNGLFFIRPSVSANFMRIDLKKLWGLQSVPALSLLDLAKAGREDVTDLLLK